MKSIIAISIPEWKKIFIDLNLSEIFPKHDMIGYCNIKIYLLKVFKVVLPLRQ